MAVRRELNDRTQWNTSSGRENPKPETAGPQQIANKDNPGNARGLGVKFTIGKNRARNLARGY